MVIRCIFSYPPKSAKECDKRMSELPSLPEYINMKGPYIDSDVRQEITAIAIYEFDESRFPEAPKHILNQLTKFQGVPGFTCSTQVRTDAKEALECARLAKKPKAGLLKQNRFGLIGIEVDHNRGSR